MKNAHHDARRPPDPPGDRVEPMMQFFEFEHLRPELQQISRPFHDLAAQLVDTLPRNPERTVALRKLLEAKDCAVRAALYR
jgi:ferritin-like protein